MIEVYRAIDATTVTRDSITLNSTKDRELSFELTATLLLIFPITLLLLTYNRQGIIGLTLLCFLIGLLIIVYRVKERLCYKMISFNRNTNIITIKQNFPKIDETILFYEAKFEERHGTVKSIEHHNFSLVYKDKRYRIFQTSEEIVPPNYFLDFMCSKEHIIDNIVNYNRSDELETVED